MRKRVAAGLSVLRVKLRKLPPSPGCGANSYSLRSLVYVPVAAKGAPAKAKATKTTTAAKNAPKAKRAAKAQGITAPREGSKTAQVVAMLQRKSGATLPEIMEKMGWQKHTVRGFMAGAMKKAGYTVESFKPEGGERTYRINS